MNERVAYLYYVYENQDEMINAVRHMNELVTVEFDDEESEQ